MGWVGWVGSTTTVGTDGGDTGTALLPVTRCATEWKNVITELTMMVIRHAGDVWFAHEVTESAEVDVVPGTSMYALSTVITTPSPAVSVWPALFTVNRELSPLISVLIVCLFIFFILRASEDFRTVYF